jgi:hypothetical protein
MAVKTSVDKDSRSIFLRIYYLQQYVLPVWYGTVLRIIFYFLFIRNTVEIVLFLLALSSSFSQHNTYLGSYSHSTFSVEGGHI